MAVKGLKYKREWQVWGKTEALLHSGDGWTFDIKKPHEGLILVGGELGSIESSIIIGNDNFVRETLKKKGIEGRGLFADTCCGPTKSCKGLPRGAPCISCAQTHSTSASTVFLESFRSRAYAGTREDRGRCCEDRGAGTPRLDL